MTSAISPGLCPRLSVLSTSYFLISTTWGIKSESASGPGLHHRTCRNKHVEEAETDLRGTSVAVEVRQCTGRASGSLNHLTRDKNR